MSSDGNDLPRGRESAADDLAVFHRTLAELCRAEIPLSHAFKALGADLERGPVQAAVRAMATQVESGVPLEEAYARHARVFPEPYRALIEAGTRSGDLPGTLEEIARDAEQRADVTHRIRRALAWPVLSGLLVLAIGAGALLFAVPRFWDFAEVVSGDSPAPYAYAALGTLALLLAGTIFLAWRRTHAGETWGFALPVIGPIRRESVRMSVASTLALLVRRNLPLSRALELTAATMSHPDSRARLDAAARRADDGAGLTEVLRDSRIYGDDILWLVEGAEARGEVERGLDEVARIGRRRLDRRLDRFTLFVRPAAELVLGVVVFCFAFSYLVPLYRHTFTIFAGS